MSEVEELEFWWLSPSERTKFEYVLPGYQESLPNDDVPDPIYGGRVKVDQLSRWCDGHQWLNVHRKLNVYSQQAEECEVLEGPILLDFDNGEEDLVSACRCSREALKFLQDEHQINVMEDCRVFFSGRKGFHIELRPTAVEPESLERVGRHRRRRFKKALIRRLRGAFRVNCDIANLLDLRGTVLDKDRDAKRINGSVNAWVDKGLVRKRRMLQVVAQELLEERPERLVAQLARRSDVTEPTG